ncbi:MAG: hypothetical protein HY474_01295 [Candidatus Sungbacteria bacterium]|uniref:Uncharacterized protein n=1 Tax=Candidatus Sungiibacteriota bacterium TaxID=2750080 RepID=A0A932YXU0_9BACT|nr:hypothetical protein [Candidatus Sungbacteria bacterium]
MAGPATERSRSDPGEIEAVVSAVYRETGQRFAVSFPRRPYPGIREGASITFSLNDWYGGEDPRKGQVVRLRRVQQFAKGWRALEARPVTLTRIEHERTEGARREP